MAGCANVAAGRPRKQWGAANCPCGLWPIGPRRLARRRAGVYPDAEAFCAVPFRPALLLPLLVLAAGCDVFAPRTPEPPDTGSGPFVQPDTPDLVVQNLTESLATLNTTAYRRSLGAGFRFTPTPAALSRDAFWASWGLAEEEAYFRTLVAAAQPGATYSLRLADVGTPEIGEARYVLDASYVLTALHRRPDAPTVVQGRLRWTITRQDDGLWYLTDWTDEALGGAPSWSDLKAAFIQ